VRVKRAITCAHGMELTISLQIDEESAPAHWVNMRLAGTSVSTPLECPQL
jgi:hypothetical protein